MLREDISATIPTLPTSVVSPVHTEGCRTSHQTFKERQARYEAAKRRNKAAHEAFKAAVASWEAEKEKFREDADIFFTTLDIRKAIQSKCAGCCGGRKTKR